LHYIVTDVVGTAREVCSETGDIIWRGEQRLWGNYRADVIPQLLRRFLGDAANEETYCELRYPLSGGRFMTRRRGCTRLCSQNAGFLSTNSSRM
ncbi:RHS domain-containing protein, partial [Aeromonas hydrophila]